MPSPNTIKRNEEIKALRNNTIKITPSPLLYGQNRKTRRTQLRQVYKEGFLTYADAKREVRLKDKENLEKISKFTTFIQRRTRELQEEYRAKGEELTEEQAFLLIKSQAYAEEQTRLAEEARSEIAERIREDGLALPV